MGLFPDWKSQLGGRDKETNMDFDPAYLAGVYSQRDRKDTMKRQYVGSVFTHPESFSPVYSVGNEKSGPLESSNKPLDVVEMYAKRDTPFKWTNEYIELDLKRKIIEVYISIAKGTELTFHEVGINFGGSINASMSLNRQIDVVEEVVQPVTYNLVDTAKSTEKLTVTLFILPQNTTHVIAIDSKTTTRQMIVALFKSLRIVDNPKKYVLYEYERQIDETAGTLTKKWTRISDDAYPLKVVLHWPVPHYGRTLVIMENRDLLTGNFENLWVFNFLESMGNESQQVDFQTQKSLRTGSHFTTYSKNQISSKDALERKDLEDFYDRQYEWCILILVFFAGFSFGLLIFFAYKLIMCLF